MKIIEYRCTRFNPPVVYQLVQLMPHVDFQLFYGNTLIGTFAIKNGACEQTGGREVTDEMVEDIGELIK